MGEFMANYKIDANDEIPPAALRSFIHVLGTKGFRFCHQTFAEHLLLDLTGNAQLNLFATIKCGIEGVYLLTTRRHSPIGEISHVDYIRTIRRLSLFKKQRCHKRNSE
ncbi:hypothetical protein H257_18958 [Aphanomyces astaci]|uniref:Uncharacterized protein n=1 Tax=Aphanomyces astaci TaxID=112090 RepID=W4FB23_APHAT|nr:hypothetical protein H257_18958 [Aphanomyces astaci]ETV64104.1 hypothetical protein H257_18958 [Aphanomyces astaci]|eukprot:XP_009846411.1 hypothetical protein H257_18958 [Aphanomyces astaci]